MVEHIKLFGLGVRKPGLAPEDFHDHWRHPHGTWARMMTTLRGYVQSHQIHSDLLGANQSRYEMIAEMWVDDLKDLREFRQEPILVKYLMSDEQNFLDMANSSFFAAEEEVVIGDSPRASHRPGDEFWSAALRPISIKLLRLVAHDDHREKTWFMNETLARNLGALRYVRCHPLRSFYADEPPFAGIDELWWPTVRSFRMGVAEAHSTWALLQAAPDVSIMLLVQAERLL